MRVLVTGSAGFVGSHLCQALTDHGISWQGIDRKTGPGIDMMSMLDLRDAARQNDVVVHLASTCSTPGSVRNPLGTYSDTVTTAVRMVEACRLEEKPFILTSSVKARDGMTPYGAAKQMAETWAQEYRAAYRLPVIINRPGTIYGPGQEGSDESGWIAWFLRARREGIKVTINGDGLAARDLLHVSDYVRLLMSQIIRPDFYNKNGYVWDVGGGSSNVVTVIEMARRLGLEYEYGPDRYGDARVYIGHNDVPGWEPTVHWRESETFRDL